MKTTTTPKSDRINLRIKPQLKMEVETILNDLGLTPAEAVNILFSQIRIWQGLPFEVRKSVPNSETIAALEESRAMARGDISKDIFDIENLAREFGYEEV